MMKTMAEKIIEKQGLTNEDLQRCQNLLNEANLQQLSALGFYMASVVQRKLKEEMKKQG